MCAAELTKAREGGVGGQGAVAEPWYHHDTET